jgi:hypothetical protein
VWLIVGLIAVFGSRRWQRQFEPASDRSRVSGGLWGLGVAAIGVWFTILPSTQREQQLRWRVENDLRGGRVGEAIAEMSRHQQSDFPPHWDPPPRPGYGEDNPSIGTVFERLEEGTSAPWVRAIYIEKLRLQVADGDWYPWEKDRLLRYYKLIARLPEGPVLISRNRDQIEAVLKYQSNDLSDEDRAALTALLQVADRHPSAADE